MRQVSRAPGSESCSLQATERKTKQVGQKESRLYIDLWRRDGKRGHELRQKEEKQQQDNAEEEVEQPTVLLSEEFLEGSQNGQVRAANAGYKAAPQLGTHHKYTSRPPLGMPGRRTLNTEVCVKIWDLEILGDWSFTCIKERRDGSTANQIL